MWYRAAPTRSASEDSHVWSGLGRKHHRRAVQLFHSRPGSAATGPAAHGNLPVLFGGRVVVLPPRLARSPLVYSGCGVVEAEVSVGTLVHAHRHRRRYSEMLVSR